MPTPLADRFVYYALHHPRRIAAVVALATTVLLALAAVPNFVDVPGLHPLRIDTDPENMLAEDEPVRVFHDRSKAVFDLSDMVVVGVVNEDHPDGVFNPQSLAKIHALTQFARDLNWTDPDDPDKRRGVVERDMIAPSMVDNIEQGGLGQVSFSWLMPTPPETRDQALAVRDRALAIPFLRGTLVSEDGRAVALYLPLTSKDMSHRVRQELLDFTADWQGSESVYITGLPVAEDTFGVEMFVQMAVSAPLAMVVIFLLLWWFFKRLVMVVSPMIVAMVSALSTMALLVISGNTIHIMSSMIPIFIMPIAVLDAVHILSEFFDRYPLHKDRQKATEEVMHTLFKPMLFTTLTTMAGFASLALTPIPPVQVFGVFVAIGVFIAWLLTILFIPAYLMLIPESRLEGYGHVAEGGEDRSALGRLLAVTGRVTCARPGWILGTALVVGAIAAWGISLIQINDNPIKWFDQEHSIRVADRVLNDHFAGTYMAYLSLKAPGDEAFDEQALLERIEQRRRKAMEDGLPGAPFRQFAERVRERAEAGAVKRPLDALQSYAEAQMEQADDEAFYAWDEILSTLDESRRAGEIFKRPPVLSWMTNLQQHLESDPRVGKINSLTDIVKTVHRELRLGQPEAFRVPDSAAAVGQVLVTYQNSHRPHDLWHFVTPDYRRASLWLQLNSGDNKDMEAVMAALDQFLAENPAPAGVKADWFGLTYINVVWQEKMVKGMLGAFAGSFVVVLLMMVMLFRSVLYGILSMIPLTFTVGLIYGIIGLVGKDYDMPVAVLSSLSLGLAVDYAIHFLARSREAVARCGSWRAAVAHVFGEPARAISRNAIVLSAGFLPLLAAPLVPYQTVGVFIATIILSAGIATLVILPALVTLLQKHLFEAKGNEETHHA